MFRSIVHWIQSRVAWQRGIVEEKQSTAKRKATCTNGGRSAFSSVPYIPARQYHMEKLLIQIWSLGTCFKMQRSLNSVLPEFERFCNWRTNGINYPQESQDEMGTSVRFVQTKERFFLPEEWYKTWFPGIRARWVVGVPDDNLNHMWEHRYHRVTSKVKWNTKQIASAELLLYRLSASLNFLRC